MHKVIDTHELPRQAEAFDFWMEEAVARFAASRTWTPLDRPHFSAELEAGALANLRVLHYHIAPFECSSGTRDELFLLIQLNGMHMSLDDGSHFEVGRSGGAFVVDCRTARRARSRYPETSEIIGVLIPREGLAHRFNGAVAKIVNRPVALSGDAALLAAQLSALIRTGPSKLSPAVAVAESEHIIDLAALAFAPLAGKPPKLGASARMVALMLKVAVEKQLANPAADRGSICAAAGVEERHANRILAQEGTSVTHLLQEHRLEKARRALKASARPICEIALECGFTDAGHFSRAFRARYGCAPSEARCSGCC